VAGASVGEAKEGRERNLGDGYHALFPGHAGVVGRNAHADPMVCERIAPDNVGGFDLFPEAMCGAPK
jgi:hypothetical protein